MREPTFPILTAPAERPRHGDGIIQQLATLSANRGTLLPGTLYTALDRLAGQAWSWWTGKRAPAAGG